MWASNYQSTNSVTCGLANINQSIQWHMWPTKYQSSNSVTCGLENINQSIRWHSGWQIAINQFSDTWVSKYQNKQFSDTWPSKYQSIKPAFLLHWKITSPSFLNSFFSRVFPYIGNGVTGYILPMHSTSCCPLVFHPAGIRTHSIPIL